MQNSRGKVPEFFLLNYQSGFKKTWQQDIKDGIFIYSTYIRSWEWDPFFAWSTHTYEQAKTASLSFLFLLDIHLQSSKFICGHSHILHITFYWNQIFSLINYSFSFFGSKQGPKFSWHCPFKVWSWLKWLVVPT